METAGEHDNLPVLPEIDVDIHSIGDFAALVRSEKDEALIPGAGRVRFQLDRGVHFGIGSPSHDVMRVRKTYEQALNQTKLLCESYVVAVDALVNAVELVAKRYSEADQLSAAQLKDVERILGDATRKAQASQPDDTRPVWGAGELIG